MQPENEMGVIVEFSQKCDLAGWEITRINGGYPDATIRNKDTGETLEVEFEYASSCFRVHKHDPRKSDLIICWKHDDGEVTLPIWVLSGPEWWKTQPKHAELFEREAAYWRWRALDAERRIRDLEANLAEVGGSATKGNNGPYPCPYCGKAFERSGQVGAHVRYECEKRGRR